MSRNDFNMLTKAKSHLHLGLASPQGSRNLNEEFLTRSPRDSSWDNSSRNASTPALGLAKNLLRIRRIPVEEMFRKTTHEHSGTLLPEHLYHPPKSSACLVRNPSYSFPKTNNKMFMRVIEEHGKRIPAPWEYNKTVNWINRFQKDLLKGSKKKTIIDQIYCEKKLIPGPADYKEMMKDKIMGGALSKTAGFNYMSDTEYRAVTWPSAAEYSIEDKLVKKRTLGFKIVKPKLDKISWKPVKSPGPAVGSYENKKELVMPKSPRAAIGTEKLKSFLDDLQKKKLKIPGVGEYDIHPCFRKIARPMRTTRW